jgi:L-ribulose-5-phosphate 3-epimerase
MTFGYNTNGFAHHRLEDTLSILAELGYGSVAITLDCHTLNPFERDLPQRVAALRSQLERVKLYSVVETGARFLLDPRRKHQPTLLSEDAAERECRLDFLRRAVDIARELNSDAVSFWSGAAPADADPAALLQRLVDGCRQLCDYAGKGQRVRLAFEPEPGMFIDRMDRFAELDQRVMHPLFGLTLDIGHLHCQGETPIEAHIRKWGRRTWNVHIEDMRRGIHEHLMFGEGEIDFPPVLWELLYNYIGGIHVELSRHSHDAVETARRALDFLWDNYHCP